MAAASSAASTDIEPGERDGHRKRDADRDHRSEGDLSRLHRAALVDGARVSREIIEHSKAATVLEAHQYQHCQHERRAKLPLKPQSAKQETCPAQYASSRRPRITMGECTGHRRPKSHSLSKNSWKGILRRWALGKDRDRNHRTNEAQHNLQTTAGSQRHFSLVKVSLWAQFQPQQARHLANAGLIDGLWLRIGHGPLSYATPD
jgi:hypothetical protein